MTFAIPLMAKIVGERLAPLATYLVAAILVVGALYWLRSDAYADGQRAEADRWREAARQLERKTEAARQAADQASGKRVDEYSRELEKEKGLIDEADAANQSPFDVLFGPERLR